jgi:hypothetical protein
LASEEENIVGVYFILNLRKYVIPVFHGFLIKNMTLFTTTIPGQATKRADAFGNLIFTNAPDPTTNNFWRIRSVP